MGRFGAAVILTHIATTAVCHARISTGFGYDALQRPALSIEIESLNNFFGQSIIPLDGGYWLCTDFIIISVDPLGNQEMEEPIILEHSESSASNRLHCNPAPQTGAILGVSD